MNSQIPKYITATIQCLGLKLSDALEVIIIDKIQKIPFQKVNSSTFQNKYLEILKQISYELSNILYSTLEILICFFPYVYICFS